VGFVTSHSCWQVLHLNVRMRCWSFIVTMRGSPWPVQHFGQADWTSDSDGA
jgi:hypothetical protein